MSLEVTRTFDLLDHMLREFPRPDSICGKKNGSWYCYSTEEYHKKSRFFALGLLAMGLNREDKIAIITNNRPEWNIADMGMAMAGIVNISLYPNISEEEYISTLLHAEVKYLIAEDIKILRRLKPVIEKVSSIQGVFLFEGSAENAKEYTEIIESGEKQEAALGEQLEEIKASIKAEDLATIIYTSGTTGEPKGVMLSHKNLTSNFIIISGLHIVDHNGRALSFLPLCHAYERMMNYHYQYKGIGVYYIGSLSQILSGLQEIKPHMFNSVPRLLEKVYQGFISKGKELKGFKRLIYHRAISITRHFEYNRKYPLLLRLKIRIYDKLVYSKWREALGGNIVYAVTGGAAIYPEISRLFGMAGILNLEGYGLTETSPVIAVNYPKKKIMKIGTVGPALNNLEVRIADDGEILCRGDSVMMGYYKSPEQTAEVIDEDGWFHTGDIGTFEDGIFLKITDRKKEMFKLSGGKYIAPQMLENKLKSSDYIEQAMVIGNNQKFPSAIISPDFNVLKEWCAKHGLTYNDNSGLIALPQVVSLIQKEVNHINKSLGAHEVIKRFRLVSDEWNTSTGELSPTLKLKRNMIVEKYRDLINEIYAG